MFRLQPGKIDFGYTDVDNIFLLDFMPMATGTQIKVYLLGYQYIKDPLKSYELDNAAIARRLNLSIGEVEEAWRYWEKLGLVHIEPGADGHMTIVYRNLKELYVETLWMKPEPKISGDVLEIVRANEDPALNDMFGQLDYLMRRPLVATERTTVLDWIKRFHMEPAVIVEAFFVATEQGKRNLRYVEGILRRWYDEGMTRKETLAEGLKREGEAYARYRRVMDLLGLSHRQVTDADRHIIDRWFTEYGYDWDMIELAAQRLYRSNAPSVSYLEGILSSWYRQGIRTPQEVEEKDRKPVQKPVKSQGAAKTRFANFDERDTDALQALLNEAMDWEEK